jgi:hypothetical protein
VPAIFSVTHVACSSVNPPLRNTPERRFLSLGVDYTPRCDVENVVIDLVGLLIFADDLLRCLPRRSQRMIGALIILESPSRIFKGVDESFSLFIAFF